MALQEVTNAFIRRLRLSERPLNDAWKLQCRQFASAPLRKREELAADVQKETAELEESDFVTTPQGAAEERLSQYDPLGNARKRKRELPRSRYAQMPMQDSHTHLLFH